MRLKPILPFLIILIFSGRSWALSFALSESSAKSYFHVGLVNSTFSFTSEKLSGMGVLVSYESLLNDTLVTRIGFSQIMQRSGTSVQGIATAVQMDVSAALWGRIRSSEQLIFSNGVVLGRIQSPRTWNIRVGAGIDQYWFSGVQAVYPASGLAVLGAVEAPLFSKYWIRTGLRIGNLTSASGNIQVTSLNVGFDW